MRKNANIFLNAQCMNIIDTLMEVKVNYSPGIDIAAIITNWTLLA
jgi:hypothetical protein